MSPETNPTPKLAPPGAGLPQIELFAARLMFGFSRLSISRNAAETTIADEQIAIGELARNCDPAEGERRVLIKRPRGCITREIPARLPALGSGRTRHGHAGVADRHPSARDPAQLKNNPPVAGADFCYHENTQTILTLRLSAAVLALGPHRSPIINSPFCD